ncbi:MAG: RNA-binding cell elongation regulator Jag/EloR [Bacillota bacterium]|nr:RNA-binding cell elongation regulator Jag/EloR [Bacillota bacterium]
MTYSEKYGVDVEEAVKYALQDLRLSRDEVEVEVLEEPSKGFLGLGSKLARVRVTPKKVEEIKEEPVIEEVVEEKTTSVEVKAEKQEKKPHNKNRNKNHNKNKNKYHKDEEINTLSLDTVNVDELTEVDDNEALEFMKEITEKMGLNLDIKARVGEGMIHLDIAGKDSGTVIGKRGATLDAIQYLTSLVVNKDNEKYIKVVVDAENYRSKRQKTLEALANRLAAKVQKNRKPVRLEPMNPYERKIIHATLQHNPHVTTRSEGEEPYRKVVIELKK